MKRLLFRAIGFLLFLPFLSPFGGAGRGVFVCFSPARTTRYSGRAARLFLILILLAVGHVQSGGQNIYTVVGYAVGGGEEGYNANGGLATNAAIVGPCGIAVDASGTVYIAEFSNNRIRTISSSGVIGTAAGTADGSTTSGGDGGQATVAHFNKPMDVTVDASGNIYIVEHDGTGSSCNVRKVTASTGIITEIAGTGSWGSSNDGGQATAAALNNPDGVALDAAGNVYIADVRSSRIRKVTVSTGVISTVAGKKDVFGFSGDGGAATSTNCQLSRPYGVRVDASNNIYIADMDNNRIRKVSAAGTITTIAGYTATAGYSGDGGQATAAQFNCPTYIAVDNATGNLYVTDQNNHCIRKITPAGIISTVAGTGTAGFSGDGGQATAAQLNFSTATAGSSQNVVCGVTYAAGYLYISDRLNRRIRKVNLTTGVITTIGGMGITGTLANGGPATSSQCHYAKDVAIDGSGNFYICEQGRYDVRKIDGSGTITTVAGIAGTSGFAGDGGPATAANMNAHAIAVDASGNLYFAGGSERIRKVTASTGIISTIAGTGATGFSGDGGQATDATMDNQGSGVLSGIAVDGSGNVYFSDKYNSRVRKITASTGVITTVAGYTATWGFAGDGGQATTAQFNEISGIDLDASGNIYIADVMNYRIRKITVSTGIITTVAGNGTYGSTGDGGQATAAQLKRPRGLAIDAAGNIYIAEDGGDLVRKVTAATGIITTIAGDGTNGYFGDGGPATAAKLNAPNGIAVSSNSDCLYIADWGNSRIRGVDLGGGASCIAILPVHMLSFNVNCEKSVVRCNWTTASEMNNDFFAVERSPDGKSWTEIGTVKGSGNSSTIRNYEFSDNELPLLTAAATLFYRIKQTDFNGKYEYFGPIAVNCSGDNTWKLIVQNIAGSSLSGTLIAVEDAALLLNIVDIQGRIVKQEEIMVSEGSNLLKVELEGVDAGMYFITFHNANVKLNQKFIKHNGSY